MSTALANVCFRPIADITAVSHNAVHVDLDVLDRDLVGPANSYALPNGLTTQQLVQQLRLILSAFPLASASVASYDPAYDVGGKVSAAAFEVVGVLATGRRDLSATTPT